MLIFDSHKKKKKSSHQCLAFAVFVVTLTHFEGQTSVCIYKVVYSPFEVSP